MASLIEQSLANAEVPLHFENQREEILIRQAVQGRDAQEFMMSPVGKFVAGAAVQEQQMIEAAIIKIKPNTRWRRRRISELQQKHDAITMAVQWLCEQVNIGAEAEKALYEPDE
ncbi:MAG: hypothetical protein KDE03_17895 [Rhodobacteraceae bacterium]|nr:hypothetical protein [Paracoccaceae bacterium]